MAVNLKYDKVVQVDIGKTGGAGGFSSLTNVVYFAESVMSPGGDLVEQLSMINSFQPDGVHQNHKYWELELALDTNYYPNSAFPERYWAYFQDVTANVPVEPAIVDNGANWPIEYFRVHIREHDGTHTTRTYANVDTNVLWCTGETSEFSNETGERHQTVTFKFICLQEVVIDTGAGAPTPVGAPQGVGKVKRINYVRENTQDAVNVLRFKEDFVMKMTPQFVPNTYQGVGMKQDEKYRVLTVTLDSWTDIFDNMLNIIAAQAIAVGNFEVEFTLDDVANTTETWAYTPVASVYMSNRREGRTEDNSTRSTVEYEFIAMSDKSVSQP